MFYVIYLEKNKWSFITEILFLLNCLYNKLEMQWDASKDTKTCRATVFLKTSRIDRTHKKTAYLTYIKNSVVSKI